MSRGQIELFAGSDGPDGLRYAADFLSADDERNLLDAFDSLPFTEAQYRAWRAKRRVVSYGGRYDFDSNVLEPAPPIPALLEPLRNRAAAFAGLASAELHHALVAEYRPGTQLGWHRDVPSFEAVVGVSLGHVGRMRFRSYPPRRGRRDIFTLDVEPRSIYVLTGPARWKWQHAVSPTKGLRYSITFRSLVR